MNTSRKADGVEASLFAQRVDQALVEFSKTFQTAIHAGAKPPRLSISNFMKASHLSRSALYSHYGHLVPLVEASLRNLSDSAKVEEKGVSKRSYSSLVKENTELRKALKQAERSSATAQFINASEQFSPYLRDRGKIVRENQKLLEKVEELERTKANLEKNLRLLMIRLNSKAGDLKA